MEPAGALKCDICDFGDRCLPTPQPFAALERWLLEMDEALKARQVLHVQPMSDGAVVALTKYADMSSFLAGRGLVDQIKAILSHIRAARQELDQPPVPPLELAALLEAERIHGRTAVTDYLWLLAQRRR